MLELLQIQNLGLVTSQAIEFHTTITAFTGETGAGKSMLLSALFLLLGGRADVSSIRTGETQASVAAEWNIKGNERALTWLNDHGIPAQDDVLNIRRVLKQNGRNQCFIHGQPVSVGELSDFTERLCEVHAQHEHQILFCSSEQVGILDQFAGIPLMASGFSQKLSQYMRKKRLFEKHQANESERLRELDYLRYAVDEIERAKILPDEDIHLTKELHIAAHREEIVRLWKTFAAYVQEEQGALTLLEKGGQTLETLMSLQGDLTESYHRYESSLLEFKDIVDVLQSEQEKLEQFDMNHLTEIESRLSLLEGLKKKYGNTLAQIQEFYLNVLERIQAFETADNDNTAREIAATHEILVSEASRINAMRIEYAPKFAAEVNNLLTKLAMEKAYFSVDLTNQENLAVLDDGSQSQPTLASFEFCVRTNVGEESKPLVKIASGGELSRIMLAIRVIGSAYYPDKTLVLDEVDAGIGGKTARVVSEYLYNLGKDTQIICVTHVPVIAACATWHYYVQKQEIDGRTIVGVDMLNKDGRQQELARMIIGDEYDTFALGQAQQLLQEFHA